MSPQRIRVGVIGAGNIATLAHIPGLLRTGAADVVAVCDTDPARAESVAMRLGCDAYEDYRRMLREASLDAVTVATPPLEHAPATLAAISEGVHVLCEKPLAMSVADAEHMVAAADEAEVVLAMNMHFRYLRESLALKAAVESGRLGSLFYIHIRYLRSDFFPPLGSWAADPRVSGGGALADMGSHLLDLALWLGGARAATSVEARLQATRAPGQSGPSPQGEDFASVRVQTDNGITVVVECSWGFFGRDESRIQLIGDRGGADVLVANGPTGRLRFYARSGDGHVEMTSTPLLTPDEADRVSLKVATRGSSSRGPRPGVNRRSRLWYRTMAGFVAAVQGQAEAAPIATGRDGLAVQRILEAAYRPRAT